MKILSRHSSHAWELAFPEIGNATEAVTPQTFPEFDLRIVIPEVAGSNPVSHPSAFVNVYVYETVSFPSLERRI